jgi:hypothetical protein
VGSYQILVMFFSRFKSQKQALWSPILKKPSKSQKTKFVANLVTSYHYFIEESHPEYN